MKIFFLILYSLSPGFSKIFDNQIWFLIGLLFFLAYIYYWNNSNKYINYVNFIIYIFIGYAILISLALVLLGLNSVESFFLGMATFLTPIIIVSIVAADRLSNFFHDLLYVCVVNAFIALLIYPLWSDYFPFISELAAPLLNGTAAYRLSSVSGSLAMSPLMIIGYGVAMRYYMGDVRLFSKEGFIFLLLSAIFFCSAMLTLQRSAWVSLAIISTACFIFGSHKKSIIFVSVLVFIALFLGLSLSMINIFPGDFSDLLSERLGSIGVGNNSAVSERMDQWRNVIINLENRPLGYGLGQVGQSVRFLDSSSSVLPIYDGDYFRIISEYSFFGFMLVCLIIATPFRYLYISKKKDDIYQKLYYKISASIALAVGFQCIGTNITELYFVNSVFWVLMITPWRNYRLF